MSSKSISNGGPELERVPSEMDDSGTDSGSDEEETVDAEQTVEDQNEVNKKLSPRCIFVHFVRIKFIYL